MTTDLDELFFKIFGTDEPLSTKEKQQVRDFFISKGYNGSNYFLLLLGEDIKTNG